MVWAILRAVPWPAVSGTSVAAAAVGGCGAAFPAAGGTLVPIAFALLAAAAAFTLDEPATLVVDVAPTGSVTRTAIRAVALLAPLAAGAAVVAAGSLRSDAAVWLALIGNVLLGFAAAGVARSFVGEPGAAVSTAVVLVLLAPGLVPPVRRWVQTFPAAHTGGLSATTVWCVLIGACLLALAASLNGRNSRVPG